jgi:LPS sulfotransferase NodH
MYAGGMTIPVRLQLLDSDDAKGVKLWIIALDGSNRAWYKWFENAGIAMIDAENMRLVETPVKVTPSADRYALDVKRRLLPETEIDEDVLETHWIGAANPPIVSNEEDTTW